MIVNGNKVNI